MILTEEQNSLIKNILKNKDKEQVTKVGGYAGTGKSTVLCRLAELLPGYAVTAYTGKACNVLRKKGVNACTIHSLIYKPVRIDDKIEFELKFKEEINFNGFLVDESSLIGKEIYDDMLSFNLPIIFIGDHGQLEPIGANINLMKNPTYRLETIHRNAGEMAHFADHLRKGKSANSFECSNKIEIIKSDVPNEVLLNVDQIICAFNKFRVKKNEEIRSLLGYKNLIEIGEKVICLKNNRRLFIFNGMQGIVEKIYPKFSAFDFISDGMYYSNIRYDRNQFGKEKNGFEFGQDDLNPFDYAYAVTCHKMQGDEANTVLVYEQSCDKWDMKKWNYTAASRTKQKLYWVLPKRQISTALYIPDYMKRK